MMMKKLTLILAALCVAGVANAATLKIATVTPEGSQWMKDMRASADEIKEKTDGRVQIKYYGGGVMGNDTKVLGRIRIGALQACTKTTVYSWARIICLCSGRRHNRYRCGNRHCRGDCDCN